jgi:hypothetical protein
MSDNGIRADDATGLGPCLVALALLQRLTDAGQ